MKNYKEMSKDVLNRIDEYETERKIKRAKITKIAASVTPVCAVAVVGVGLWKGGILTTDHDQFIVSNVETTVSDTEQNIAENNDVVNNVIEDVTSSVTTEKENNTSKETEDIHSDSVVNVIPETEIPENEGLIPEIETPENEVGIPETSETPQFNTEIDNSNINSAIGTPETEAHQSTDNNIVSAENISSSSKNEENDINHYMKHVIVNGEAYVEYDAGTEIYTPDTCLGSPSDYDGNYRASFSDISATLYTAKESSEILMVKEPNNSVDLIRAHE